TLKDNAITPIKGKFESPLGVDLKFDEATSDACPAFTGRLLRGVKNTASPDWMQRRLKAIGLRPINALADITNYITYDYGRPLHVYDADRVNGNIHARMGKKGEQFEALDGKTYEVDEECCVIADDSGVLGLGGIIGGESSGCSEDTVNVFIESALFDPRRIAATGRRLGIESDARYRFERGVDPGFMGPGAELATKLVMEICGGEPSHMVMAGKMPDTDRIIDFETKQVKRLTGADIDTAEIRVILKRLGFWVAGHGEELKVSPPGWRPDIHESACLVEEVIRIAGMDRMPSEPLARLNAVARPVLTPAQKRARRARRALAGCGMVETVTWSFIPRDQARDFGGGSDDLEVVNPISSEMSSMRPSLLPGLISAARRNTDRGFADLALFEVGQAYRGEKPEDQFLAASGIRSGSARLIGAGRHWDGQMKTVDVFDVRADALAVLDAAKAPLANIQTAPEAPGWFHPGRSGVLRLGPKTVLAHFGELHPAVLKALGASGPMVGFEVFLDAIPAPRAKTKKSRSALNVSDLQAVRRDFAFIVDKDLPAQDLIRAARGADKNLVTDVVLFDVFSGGNLGDDKKSLAIEVTLQPREKTLTDTEIEAVASKIIEKTIKATGAVLRSQGTS
ncbi:MAG TPA: phenylalanine--tRNA ligase subunit beta, partial [Rhizobiales bacterium]|nr:phenylalanine--tRNA ligase subunit beta [Hyphomicrobiales bacterium]